MNNKITPVPSKEDIYTDELKKKVAQCLKRVMFDYEISGKKLANMSGFNATYISHLRSGKKLPDFKNFMILVDSLPEEARKCFLGLLFENSNLIFTEKQNSYKV